MGSQQLQNKAFSEIFDFQNAFGMGIKSREFVEFRNFRYSFNGKEKTDEISGSGASYDYGFRIYDPRLSRFLSVDPLNKSYPMLTPYQFASNKPINSIDIDGLESADVYHYLDVDGKLTGGTTIKIREQEGCLGDGILVHQMIMTSDNPGGAIQNYEYKEDWSKATYTPSSEAVANSLKTEKMQKENMETAFPALKGFRRFKSWLHKVDIAMQGVSDPANMGTTSKAEWEGVAQGIQTAGKVTKGAGIATTLFPGGQLAGPVVFGIGTELEGAGDVMEITVALAYGENDKALLKTFNLVLGTASGKLMKIETDDFESMVGETVVNETMDKFTDMATEAPKK